MQDLSKLSKAEKIQVIDVKFSIFLYIVLNNLTQTDF